MSLTTTTGQQKGQPAHSIPAEKDFPLPYTDTFDTYAVGKQPKYTIDQSGAFEIAIDGSNKYLRQVITSDIKPIDWERRASPSPYTLLGGQEWANYEVSADVRIESNEGYVLLGGRCNFSPTGNVPAECYNLRIFYNGEWQLRKAALVLASGTLPSFNINTWYPVKLSFNKTNIKAYFNGTEIASVTDSEIPSGHIVLGSGYNLAGFDNLLVSPVDSSTPESCLRYEDRDFRIEYVGSWSDFENNAKNYTRTLQTASTADHYMELAFNGTAVSVLGMVNTDCGYADIYVDDIYQATIDAYSNPVKYRKALFSIYDLSPGNHKLKLVLKGTKRSASSGTNIYIDAIEVQGGTGLIPLVHTPMPDTAIEPEIIFTENFESGTTGQPPSGWSITAASNTSALIGSVPSESNKSLKLTDNNSSGAVSAQKAFGAQTDYLTVSYRFNAETVGKWSRIYLKDGSNNVIEIYDSNVNGLCYRNSSASDIKIADISAGVWYTIRLDIDIPSNKFNVYLNDVLKLSDCSFRRSAAKIDGIVLESGGGFVGNSYFDDIIVEVADLVHEDFNSGITGQSPLGWSATAPSSTSCQVQNFPDATNKSLRLYDNNSSQNVTAIKPFALQKGIVVAEYSFNDSATGIWSRFLLSNGSTNAIEIYNSDLAGLCYRDGLGKDIKIMDISPNTWYTVKIVANVATDRFDIYVNGVLKKAGCTFRNVVSGINRVTLGSGQSYTGTTYFDDVSMQKVQ